MKFYSDLQKYGADEVTLRLCYTRHNRPLSVNSQAGGQNNKIVLNLKGLFLSGERTTIVLSSRLGITEMGITEIGNS